MSTHKRQRNQVNETQKANRVTLEAQTPRQKEYLQALREHDQVFAIGPAGTGKTYLPTVLATKMYLMGTIRKIIIARPAVAACGEDLGFLPGDLNKKLAPWALPVTEIIQDIVGRDQMDQMIKSGDLEIAAFAYLRGRTLSNAFIILDEAQNTTKEQMELFLTRTGQGSRLVICGDLKQSDLRGASGLECCVNLIERYKIPAAVVKFTTADIVRSDICKQWAEAFDRGA